MENNLDNILTKLQHLKAMYEGAKKINSESEAANAASAIQRILTKYNLALEDIKDNSANNIEYMNVSGFTYKSIGGKWEKVLTSILCQHNFCKILSSNGYKHLTIIGKKENIKTVVWLKSTLSERYVNFSKDRYKIYKKTFDGLSNSMPIDTYQRSYLLGCACGLNVKLNMDEEEFRKNKIDAECLTSLVVANETELQDFINKNFDVTYKKSKFPKVHDSVFSSGYEDGVKTELYKPIE